jgi:hypothetical protein
MGIEDEISAAVAEGVSEAVAEAVVEASLEELEAAAEAAYAEWEALGEIDKTVVRTLPEERTDGVAREGARPEDPPATDK